jgi:hypothetical protein
MGEETAGPGQAAALSRDLLDLVFAVVSAFSGAGMAAGPAGAVVRRRVVVTGRASKATAALTHRTHRKPPVRATFAGLPSLSRVPRWVTATVDAIATAIAPPSCCEVLISPEASPASCVRRPRATYVVAAYLAGAAR